MTTLRRRRSRGRTKTTTLNDVAAGGGVEAIARRYGGEPTVSRAAEVAFLAVRPCPPPRHVRPFIPLERTVFRVDQGAAGRRRNVLLCVARAIYVARSRLVYTGRSTYNHRYFLYYLCLQPASRRRRRCSDTKLLRNDVERTVFILFSTCTAS